MVPTDIRSSVGTTPGTKPDRHPRAHGEEDPERQVAIEEREAAGHAGARRRDEGGFGHELEAPDERRAGAACGARCVADPRPVDVPADQSASLSTLRCCETVDWARELVDDVAADARLAADEQAEDLDPRRMPDRLREQRQLLVGLVALDGAQVRLIVRRRRRAVGTFFSRRPYRSSTIRRAPRQAQASGSGRSLPAR